MLGGVATALTALYALNVGGPGPATDELDPREREAAERGSALYLTHCAECHGSRLEGQPHWKHRRPDGTYPAPPHDETGHTWHHPDWQLRSIIREGGQARATAGFRSGMPAFGDKLNDEEIDAVLAFIKSYWPPEIRRRQEEANRGRHP